MMKKAFLIMMFLAAGVLMSAQAAYVCPSPDDVQAKMSYFRQKALEGMSQKSGTAVDMSALLKEQEEYVANLYSGCLNYLKNTPNPDCKKTTTFMTGYMLLPKEKSNSATAQVKNLAEKLKTACPSEVESLKVFLK